MSLAEHHVPGSKDTYYIPNFVTANEEAYLIRKASQLFVPHLSVSPIHQGCRADPGDPPAQVEATFESEVCPQLIYARLFQQLCCRLQTWGESGARLRVYCLLCSIRRLCRQAWLLPRPLAHVSF